MSTKPGQLQRAVVAVAHSLLIAIYHLVRDGVVFQDLGAEHWDRRHRDQLAQRSLRRLQELGYRVTLEDIA